MIIGVILTIITGLIWTLVGVLYSRQAEKPHSIYPFLFSSALVSIAIAWTVRMPQAAPAAEVCKIAAILLPGSLCGQVGFFVLYRAMQSGPHGIAWSIAQAAMVVPFLAGWLLFDQPAGALRLSGMCLLAAALFLMGYGKNRKKGTVSERKKNFLLLCGISMLLTGIQQTVTLIPSEMGLSEAALSWRVPIASLWGLSWGILLLIKREPLNKKSFVSGIWYGAVVICGQITVYFAIDFLKSASASGIVYPLAVGCCIAFFAIYCFIFRKEKSSVPELAGLLMLLTGIILLSS